MYENDAWVNKSELYYVSQGSYACPMTISQASYVHSMTTTNLTSHASSFGDYQYSNTTAALTSSCEPSVGFFFSFGDFFSSSSIQASHYDNQNNSLQKSAAVLTK